MNKPMEIRKPELITDKLRIKSEQNKRSFSLLINFLKFSSLKKLTKSKCEQKMPREQSKVKLRRLAQNAM